MAAKSHVEDPVLAEMSYDVQFAVRAGQEDYTSYKAIVKCLVAKLVRIKCLGSRKKEFELRN